MRIVIITSDGDLEEIERTKEEAVKAGHDVTILDYTNFHYAFVDGQTTFNPELPECDVVIIRGMFSAMRSIDILKEYLIKRGVRVFDNSLLTHKYSINKVLDIT